MIVNFRGTSLVFMALVGYFSNASAQPYGAINEFNPNGTMNLVGYQAGTTARVEWASSLTQTNWNLLKHAIVTNFDTSSDWPLYFRVEGVPDTNMLKGLVVYYSFSGNLLDSSAYLHHGTNTGGVFGSDRFGRPSSALLLNGIDQFAQGHTNISKILSNNDFTVSAWINPSQTMGTNDFDFIADMRTPLQEGWALTIEALQNPSVLGNYLKLGVECSQSVTSQVFSVSPNDLGSGNWRHVTGVWSSNSVSLYVDGSLVSSSSHNQPRCAIEAPLFIGRRHSATRYFTGYIDDLRIYARALNDSEVRNLHRMPY